MALFVLIVVGVVVAQTWLDWRDARQKAVLPDWAKGAALAGVIAVSLTSLASFASIWIRDAANQADSGFGFGFFWSCLGFLCCMMGAIVLAIRLKRLRLMFLLAAALIAAFWLGMTLLF